MSIPPPQGMSEVDYEAIEAAVTETVRGRWFLAEFARRSRGAETRLLLDAMARLEATVAASQTALPSADPSIRLLIQRIKEIAGQLDGLARNMRDDDIEDRYWTAVDLQARAVMGLMRSATPTKPALPPAEERTETVPVARLPRAVPAPLAPRSDPEADPRHSSGHPVPVPTSEDPRLTALSGLDSLTLAKKLALFS